MGLIRDRSRRSAPVKMLIFGLFLIGLQAYMAAGSGAAQFIVGFSLKKLLIQVPAGIVAVWIASRIFDFDFGTIGTIAQKIAAITVLAEGVACWIPIPFFSIIADLTVMLVGFFVLFELSKWQTYLVVMLNFAVLFGAHHLLANYNSRATSYGSRPAPAVARSQGSEAIRLMALHPGSRASLPGHARPSARQLHLPSGAIDGPMGKFSSVEFSVTSIYMAAASWAMSCDRGRRMSRPTV
jgi:hypothetical protein